MDERRVCFVVMGFGKKTDFESGRTLDLDATYEAIIRPAAEAADLRCIRADEIAHSGVIDVAMYDMLLRADLVVADISTGNVNAMYELGVRHALRPNSTIVMRESEGRLNFDLNHVATFRYEHLGSDIGNREARRAGHDLQVLIRETLAASKPDSPVYAYLPLLQQPRLSEQQYAELLDQTEEAQERLAGLMRFGEEALRGGRHGDAARSFGLAAELKPEEPYILQRLALATYKSKAPSELEALINGLQIMERLRPERSNDPETLGITGAIRKRLWALTQDRVQLDAAVRLYGRGYEVRRDYYNGENLALCYDFRSGTQQDADEARYDLMSARKVRLALIGSLAELVASAQFDERSDRRWVFATLANSHFATGGAAKGAEYEALFRAEDPVAWEIETYEAGKAEALRVAAGDNGAG